MNAYLRTLPLPGAVRPVREHGASALDRAVVAWSAPDPAARILDPSGAPTGQAVVRAQLSPWAAPDPVMRFDLPAPDLTRRPAPIDGRIPWTDLIEPRYVVGVPDLQSASRAAIAAPQAVSPGAVWPAPSLADAAPLAPPEPEPERRGVTTRLVVGAAVVAGAIAAGATALVALL